MNELMRKKKILITACNIFPNDGGDKRVSLSLLNKLSVGSELHFINIINEREYTRQEKEDLQNICKSILILKESYFNNVISLLLSFLFKNAFMVVRRKRRRKISKQIAEAIKLIEPDVIIWDHIRSISYFAQNNFYNILLEHNFEAGIYTEKINLYPKLFKKILKKQVDFIDSFNKKANDLMQKVIYLSDADAEHYKLPQAAIWKFRSISFFHSDYFVNEKSILNLLFVGSLEWYPNIEGINWFIDNVLPSLGKNYQLTIVGKNPTDKFKKKVISNKQIRFFYNVPSVEQYYMDADIFISPIFLGLGINIKIIEAASFGIPMVVSNHSLKGYESLNFIPVADTTTDFIDRIKYVSQLETRLVLNKKINDWYSNDLEKDKVSFELLFSSNNS